MPPNIHPEKKPGERCLMSSERIRCYFSNLKATVTTRVQNFGFASKFLTPSFGQRSLDSSDFSRFVSGVFLQKLLLKSRYRKSCKHWECSDATKWVHRRGSSESKFYEIPDAPWDRCSVELRCSAKRLDEHRSQGLVRWGAKWRWLDCIDGIDVVDCWA